MTTARIETGDVGAIQRRTVGLLVSGQILGGLGFGATLSMGALLFFDLTGSPALSGMASTMSTLGAAIAAIPLARLAQRRGRRVSLSTGAVLASAGAVVTVMSAATNLVVLLFVGIALMGMGNAANLQARFAATDLAAPQNRGRDLSVVVWSTTIGAVIGPNLLEPGEAIGRSIGLPPYTGPFLLTVVAQLAAATIYLLFLRPDPLLLAARLRAEALLEAASSGVATVVETGLPARYFRFALLAVALSHAVMVSVMAMTPVHLTAGGASLTVVGITISLHVLGMFALSPIFGIMADRLGRVTAILIGQGLLVLGLLGAGLGADSHTWVAVGLFFVGLGWSASTIAGSALVTESTLPAFRTRNQGRNDLVMNLSGAIGGAVAGSIVALAGYGGLAGVAGLLVTVVVAAALVLGRAQRVDLH